ncbi:hypothetical protein CRE_07180 [Caenorhabditis remanei]|uniref:CULT domain-containing protein n=1 Tax=Caenorhabditis remanei TaxID=31234 RepID=E3NU32_CAERE|nr:hypothetical protein CRE_07180 [Caenorhabditis remanei]
MSQGINRRFDYALQENENRENYENVAKLTEYGTNWFPICGVSAVCFPDLSMELVGVHRCKVLEHNLQNGEALVQLLPEVEIPSLLPNHVPRYAKNYPITEQRSLASRLTGYPFDSLRDVTNNLIEQCCYELREMVGESAVNQAKAKGLASFSYYVSQKIFSNRKTEYSLLKEDSANTRIAAALKYCKISIGKCARCNTRIFRNQHIMRLSEQTMTHVNAHGFVHRITLLSEIKNYGRASLPSYEYTWFPDYAWMIIQCIRCHQHIGWEYISMTRAPHRFYGIQREGIRFQNDEEDEEEIDEEDHRNNQEQIEESDDHVDEEENVDSDSGQSLDE